jgi:transcriptional regulator with PAS, ATPase and Fis domain
LRAIRSILWIGPGEGLAASGIGEAPSLDVTWVRSVNEALALPALAFDGAVLEGCEPAALDDALARLAQRPGAAPLLVCLRDRDHAHMRRLLAGGASEVILTSDDASAPPLLDELLGRVDRLATGTPPGETGGAAGSQAAPPFRDGLVCSRAMRSVYALAERARGSAATVLLTGETGTGKEVLARWIHAGGPRKSQRFVAVNCAAFPESLLESELFGHCKGAFTGADRDKPGLFEAAHRGTLFLDEAGETSPALQAKLLRVLQEREVRPVGSAKARAVDVRVIAATNRSLVAEIEAGRFRQDLYYRLAVFPIGVPALRERVPDILPLARHFLAQHGTREGKPGCRFTPAAERLLATHGWPGNVRELENEVQRALALAEPGALITPRLLSPRVLGVLEALDRGGRRGETLHEALDRVEAWLIRRALAHNAGRRAVTARKLGVTREGLYKKMKRLGIEGL